MFVKSNIDDGGFFRVERSKLSEKKDKGKHQIDENGYCKHCKSMDLDLEMLRIFDIYICKKCKFEKIAFITKTTCQKEYLLQEEELSMFKFLVRVNPYKNSWSNMCLYIRSEIESFSHKKFGSIEKLKEEKNRRKDELIRKKCNKLKKSIRDLKKRTILNSTEDCKHIHKFESIKSGQSACSCGLVIEDEDI